MTLYPPAGSPAEVTKAAEARRKAYTLALVQWEQAADDYRAVRSHRSLHHPEVEAARAAVHDAAEAYRALS